METCRRNHPRTPENTYVNPGNGKRYCRVCAKTRKRKGPAPLKAPCRSKKVAVHMTQAEVDRMRALVPCMGCGAVAYGPVGEVPVTDHEKNCVVGYDIAAQEALKLSRAREKAWATRRKNAEAVASALQQATTAMTQSNKNTVAA